MSRLVDRLGVSQISAVKNSVGDRTNGEKTANRHGPRRPYNRSDQAEGKLPIGPRPGVT